MALENALYRQNQLYQARLDRHFIRGCFGGAEGACGASELQVSVSSGLTVTIGAGTAVVNGRNSFPEQGAYMVRNNGNMSLLLPANQTVTVYLQVFDTNEGDGSNSQVIGYYVGTGTPPGSSIKLAQVITGASTIDPANILDRRVIVPSPKPGSIAPFHFAALPSARVTHSVSHTFGPGLSFALNFDTERWDNDSIHDPSVNGRLTCKTPGIYIISGSVVWSALVAPEVAVYIRLNGGTTIASQKIHTTSGSVLADMTCTTVWKMNLNDWVDLVCTNQNQASNRDVVKLPNYSPEFSMTWLAP